MKRRQNQAIVLFMLFAWILCVLTPGLAVAKTLADSDDLDEIDKQLGAAEQRIAELRGRYVKPLEVDEERDFNQRYFRAVTLFKGGDYMHSAIIFGDLIEYPNAENHPKYYDLMFYYGESLAKSENYGTARVWLEKVVEFGELKPHFKQALVSLISISVELGRLEEAEHYQKVMTRTQGGEGWDVIQYAYAKSIYEKDALDQAFKTFSNIPTSSSLYAKSRYFMGAILVSQGKLDEALEYFDEVRQLKLEGDNGERVHELATMASARILFEKKEFDKALSLYRQIDVESPYFDQAYYEITWIYIQDKKYDEAASTLAILLLALPDSLYAPNSQVLKGNIHLWQHQYHEAGISFETVINKYANVVDTMDGLLKASAGKQAEEIQRAVLGSEATLPKLVVGWLAQEEEVKEAMALGKDVAQSNADVEESQHIIDLLKLHLSQNSKANLFPTLRKGREEGVVLQHQLTEIRQRLVSLSNDLIGDRQVQSDRDRLAEIQMRRRELEAMYATIPKTRKDRIQRRNRRVSRMEELDRKVYELRLQLKGLDEMMNNVESRRQQLYGDPKLSKTHLNEVKKEVEQSRQEILAMIRDLEALQSEVATGLDVAKLGDEANMRDEAVRNEIDRVLVEEKQILSRLRSTMTAEELAFFDRIEASKKRSDMLEVQTKKYFADLEMLVSDRVDGFERDVAREESLISDLRGELALHESEANEMAAEIAYRNLQTVRDQFFDVVLKANVGLVDIAWERRQEVRDKIDKVLEQMGQEQKHLTKSFEELRGEVD